MCQRWTCSELIRLWSSSWCCAVRTLSFWSCLSTPEHTANANCKYSSQILTVFPHFSSPPTRSGGLTAVYIHTERRVVFIIKEHWSGWDPCPSFDRDWLPFCCGCKCAVKAAAKLSCSQVVTNQLPLQNLALTRIWKGTQRQAGSSSKLITRKPSRHSPGWLMCG